MHRAKIIQFERLLEGPEAELQRVVEANLATIFPPSAKHLPLVLASLTLGAGRPDIVLGSFDEQVTRLARVSSECKELLPYLRLARPAKAKTIARRLDRLPDAVEAQLSHLVRERIVIRKRGIYSLSRRWRAIIPDIVAVEIKVENWRRGLAQAARNRIFAHRSYLALPESIARRVKQDKLFAALGVGLLGVAPSGSVVIVKLARRTTPKVWSYYFALANEAAIHLSRSRPRAVRRINRRRKRTIP